MTWERLQTTKWHKAAMPADAVTVSTVGTNGSKTNKLSVAITFGAAKVEELGLVEGRCDVERGHDSFHGLVRIEAAESGARRYGRLPGPGDGRLRVTLPGEFLGITSPQDPERVKASAEPSGAILITLPKWAWNYGERAAKS